MPYREEHVLDELCSGVNSCGAVGYGFNVNESIYIK